MSLTSNRHFTSYFLSVDQVPLDAVFTFVDLSYSGEMRIVDRVGLDEGSWGFYTREEFLITDYPYTEKDPLNYSSLSVIIYDLLIDHYVQQIEGDKRLVINLKNEDLAVTWGPFYRGKVIYLDLSILINLLDIGVITEIGQIVPIDDASFSCEYLETDPVMEDFDRLGYICTFTDSQN